MKSMTCSQLGGACEKVFTAATFDEIAALSQQHGKEQFGSQDAAHMAAMNEMMAIMQNGQLDVWMNARKAEFDAL